MLFSNKLFIGETIDDAQSIISMLNDNTPILGIYLICVDKKSKNLLDILESNQLFNLANRKKNYIILGIANGKKESFEVLTEIIKWWISENRDFRRFKSLL